MTGAKAEAGGWAEHAAAAALADGLAARDAATAPPAESIYDGIEHLVGLVVAVFSRLYGGSMVVLKTATTPAGAQSRNAPAAGQPTQRAAAAMSSGTPA